MRHKVEIHGLKTEIIVDADPCITDDGYLIFYGKTGILAAAWSQDEWRSVVTIPENKTVENGTKHIHGVLESVI